MLGSSGQEGGGGHRNAHDFLIFEEGESSLCLGTYMLWGTTPTIDLKKEYLEQFAGELPTKKKGPTDLQTFPRIRTASRKFIAPEEALTVIWKRVTDTSGTRCRQPR